MTRGQPVSVVFYKSFITLVIQENILEVLQQVEVQSKVFIFILQLDAIRWDPPAERRRSIEHDGHDG